MFEKLDAVLDRFRELDEEIAQPEVIQNYEKYQACLKERASLQPLVEKYQQYLSVSRHLSEAEELLSGCCLLENINCYNYTYDNHKVDIPEVNQRI